MKRAHVIRHVDFEDAGLLAEVLPEHHFNLSYVDAGRDGLAGFDASRSDLLIVMGGPISVNDEADFPFIKQELRILRERLEQDRPTLGVCLGAQLMARALDSRIYPGPEKEIGWKPLILTPAGELHPLRHLCAENTSVLHWHGETFDLPAGAVHLASTDRYSQQAFAWKRNGLALQFHPEVTAASLERWYIGHIGEIRSTSNITIAGLRAAAAMYEAPLRAQGKQFWNEWLSGIGV